MPKFTQIQYIPFFVHQKCSDFQKFLCQVRLLQIPFSPTVDPAHHSGGRVWDHLHCLTEPELNFDFDPWFSKKKNHPKCITFINPVAKSTQTRGPAGGRRRTRFWVWRGFPFEGKRTGGGPKMNSTDYLPHINLIPV